MTESDSFLNGIQQDDDEINMKSNIQSFISLYNSSEAVLKKQIDELFKITDEMEKSHRVTTTGSLVGGVIGAAGGLAAIAGLALSTVTFGSSLIVGGIAVGFLGGATGAASNVTGLIINKTAREKIETITNRFSENLFPLIEKLKTIRSYFEVIKNTDPLEGNSEKVNAQLSGVRVAGSATVAVLKRVGLAKIDKVGALMSRTIKVAGKLSGVLSGLFLILDMFSIYRDATEIREMYNKNSDGEVNLQSETLRFIHEMRHTATQFQVTLDELKEVKDELEKHILRDIS